MITSPNPPHRVWLDRNLGATAVCADADGNGIAGVGDEACYGDLYQWGRAKEAVLPPLVVMMGVVSTLSSSSVGTLKPAGQISLTPPSAHGEKILFKGLTYRLITSPNPPHRVWLDSNLGATAVCATPRVMTIFCSPPLVQITITSLIAYTCYTVTISIGTLPIKPLKTATKWT
jgi:hypothetical protein